VLGPQGLKPLRRLGTATARLKACPDGEGRFGGRPGGSETRPYDDGARDVTGKVPTASQFPFVGIQMTWIRVRHLGPLSGLE
jgi:hypothetical protein